MDPALENAIFQWEEGERRLREAPDLERADLERAAGVVLPELRRRLGSAFSLEELAELYNAGTDWALELAESRAGTEAAIVVDAVFQRYARSSLNYAGGRRRSRL